jgi:hypothetical protein
MVASSRLGESEVVISTANPVVGRAKRGRSMAHDAIRNSTLVRTVGDVLGDLSDLVQKEIRLAQAEATAKMTGCGRADDEVRSAAACFRGSVIVLLAFGSQQGPVCWYGSRRCGLRFARGRSAANILSLRADNQRSIRQPGNSKWNRTLWYRCLRSPAILSAPANEPDAIAGRRLCAL